MKVRDLVEFAEQHAVAIRRQAMCKRLDALDPLDTRIQDMLRCRVVIGSPTNGSNEEDRRILAADARVWSGIAKGLPDGTLFVLLNPNQTPERMRVTVLEEIAHRDLGHEMSQLVDGRSYEPQLEREAYWTAAAALLPREAVARAVWQGKRPQVLSAKYGCSVELVEMRVKTLNLWSEYQPALEQ